MKDMDLIEAKHYLEKLKIKRSLWDLKQDVLSGTLNATKKGNYFFVNEEDLRRAYGFTTEQIDGPTYFVLRQDGWNPRDIAERVLTPQKAGDKRSAMSAARMFEKNIESGTYDNLENMIANIKEHYEIIGQREQIHREIVEKWGKKEEVNILREQLKEEKIIRCKIHEADKGILLQLPITREKRTIPGLYSNLMNYLQSRSLYGELIRQRISISAIDKDGFMAFKYEGNTTEIINTLRAYFTKEQPLGFAESGIKVKLYIPSRLLIASTPDTFEDVGAGMRVKDTLVSAEKAMEILKVDKRKLTKLAAESEIVETVERSGQMLYRIKGR